jgi:hypothetical protein
LTFTNNGGVLIRLIGHGHNMTLDPGQSRPVPVALHGEALRQGAIASDPSQVVTKSDVEMPPEVVETDPAMRENSLEDVIRMMAAENNSQDWGANGRPMTKYVIERLGYKVSAKEIADAWHKISAEG